MAPITSNAHRHTASGFAPVSPRFIVIGSDTQSRSVNRSETTGLRAAFTITGSHAYATGTFALNAANGFTHAMTR